MIEKTLPSLGGECDKEWLNNGYKHAWKLNDGIIKNVYICNGKLEEEKNGLHKSNKRK